MSSTPRGSLSGAGRPRSPAPAAGLATRPKLSSASPLARDNSETSLGTSGAASKIRAQKVRTGAASVLAVTVITVLQMSKEDLLLPGPARSDSSCSLGRVSVDGARDARDVTRDAREVTRDARDSREALCDTSSEVSDEGYKSSQGNVSAKTEPDTADTDQARPGASSEGE